MATNEKTFVGDNIDTFSNKPTQLYPPQWNGLFGQHGWICPKCGRVYSPFTTMCLYCGIRLTPNSTHATPEPTSRIQYGSK